MPKTSRGGGKTLTYLLALAATSFTAQAAVNWTGTAGDNKFSNNSNWANGGNIVLDNSQSPRSALIYLDKDYTSAYKLGSDTAKGRNIHVRALPTGQPCWHICGWYGDAIHKYDMTGVTGNWSINFGNFESGSYTTKVRLSAIKFKMHNITVGNTSGTGAGIVVLDEYDNDGTTYRGPVTLEAKKTSNSNGKFIIYKGEVTSSNAVITCGSDLEVGNKSTGSLTICGGTVSVSDSAWTYVGHNSGSVGVINLYGGILKTRHIDEGSGDGTVVFNGGTLQANAAYEDYGGLIYGNVDVTVNEGGGTIDNGGFNVSIGAVLDGTGGLTFKGRGTTTLNGAVTYEGATTIEVGTAVVVASADNIGGGLVLTDPATAPADGVYTVLSVSGDETLEEFTLPDAPENCSLRLSADKKSILCIYGNPQNTWIGGASGSLSDAAGWSLGFVPTSGDSCVINNALAASLAVGDTFAPSAITFGESSAAVTINGGELSNITKIENRSSVRHVFNCAVSGNEIDFCNTSHCCEFRGGITLASATFTGTASETAKGLVGKWHFTEGWTPVSNNRIYGNSSVTVDGELLNSNNMSIDSGAVVTAATMRATTSTYPVYKNSGRLVITGMVDVASTSGDFCLARTDGDNATIIAGGIVYNTGNWPWLNAKTLVLGADGIKFDSSHNNNLRFSGTSTLYARDAATTLHKGKDDRQAYTIDNGKTLTVCTTQFDSSEPSTITIDGKIVGKYDNNHTGGMAVTGCGTLVFNSVSTFTGGLSVGGTATVKVNEGCTPGSGTVTLGAGTTLALTAESREFTPLANTLNLPTEGTATIRIDGKRLRSREHVIASNVTGASENVKLDGKSSALAGRKATLRVEEGKLILNIVSNGTVIIVR